MQRKIEKIEIEKQSFVIDIVLLTVQMFKEIKKCKYRRKKNMNEGSEKRFSQYMSLDL